MADSRPVALFLPVNSPGHINTCVAIADRLGQEYAYKCVFAIVGEVLGDGIEGRGHLLVRLQDKVDEKQIADNGGQEEKSFIRAFESNSEKFASAKTPLETMAAVSGFFENAYVPKLIRNFHQIGPIIQEFNPAITVVEDFFVAPYLLTNSDRYPWIRVNSSSPLSLLKAKLASGIKPASWIGTELKTKEERQRLRQEEPDEWQKLLDKWENESGQTRRFLSNACKLLRNYYASQGLGHWLLGAQASSNTPDFPCINSPYVNFYMCSEALDYTEEDDILEYPSKFLRCESLMRNSLPSQTEQKRWLDLIKAKSVGKEACVLFSLGSIVSADSKLVQRYLDILGQDQRRLYIVSKGLLNQDAKLNEQNTIGDTYIPQPFLLQHVQLAVVHGGNNGVTECLYNGVPMIVTPMFSDQFDNAQRVVDKRLGARLNLHNCTQQELDRKSVV